MKRLTILLGMCLVYTSASADIVLAGSQSRYQLQLTAPIASTLLESVNFTGHQTVSLPKVGPFGPCTGTISTVTVGTQTLSCQDRSSCFYMSSKPSCTVTFVSTKNQPAGNFCKIQSEEPFTFNRGPSLGKGIGPMPLGAALGH